MSVTAALSTHTAMRQALNGRVLSSAARVMSRDVDWFNLSESYEATSEVADVVNAGVRQEAVQTQAFQNQAYAELGVTANEPTLSIDQSLRTGTTPELSYRRVGSDMRRYLNDGAPQGVALELVMQRLEEMITDDLAMAMREQSRRFYMANERTTRGYRRVVRPELSTTGTCGLCLVASDRLYSRGDLLPIHSRCVVGDTRVSAKGVRAVTRRSYTGPFVVITTASGQEMTITANHPVLTDQGWIPADLIEVGSQVVRTRAQHGMVLGGPDEQNGPTTAEDLWRSLTMEFGVAPSSVPISAEDFHGDGADGKVDIVFTDGLLSNIAGVSFFQPGHELSLISGGVLGGLLNTFSPISQEMFVPHDASSGLIGGLGNGGSILPGGANISQLIGLRDGSHGGVRLCEHPVNNAPLDGIDLAEFQNTGASKVPARDLVTRQLNALTPRFDPSLFEFSGEGRSAYATLGRDLRTRLAGEVELDRVVDVRRIYGSHYVYNLHTVEGWYSANTNIISNCRCDTLPVTKDYDPGDLNDVDLAAIYEAAGSNQAGDLLNVKVLTEAHGELGPRIVDAKHPGNTDFKSHLRNRIPRTEQKYVEILTNSERHALDIEARISAGIATNHQRSALQEYRKDADEARTWLRNFHAGRDRLAAQRRNA